MKRVFVAILTAVLCITGIVLAACPSMDLTGDCVVDLNDFSLLANQWLSTYDQNELSTMASQWLTEGTPDPAGMVWVSINDSGAGMKDENGNPISHGGFNGYMSKYLTTNAQYCQYLNAAIASNQITIYKNVVYAVGDTSHSQPYFNPYAAVSYSQITYSGGIFSVRSRDGYSMDTHPVTSVSWYGATAFCNYYSYRLPTEWEWQAVADYDGSYTYGCGTTISQSKANYVYANPLGLTSYPYTSPVGYYPAYGYGLCDMAGNVWEWTSTDYHGYRVFRGGSWFDNGGTCSVSDRIYDSPFITGYCYGFRVCR